jgi:2-hydroxychromene-2-carboxylate isomerase
MEAEYDVRVGFRVVHPLAIRTPEFFERSNPLMQAYVAMDTRRVAEFLGIPFVWPRPDPVVVDAATRKFAVEQPYIFWLSRLGIEAARRGRGLAFADEVSRMLWGGEVRDWHQGDHLAGAASRAGLVLAELEAAISAQGADHDAEIADNHAALTAAGHWGVPTLVFRNEPFFGQDRLEICLQRMKQHGLRARA